MMNVDMYEWTKLQNCLKTDSIGHVCPQRLSNTLKTCGRCVSRKTLLKRSSPLNQITSNGPLALVCIDFLQIEPDNKGVANVLVVTDHFTRYAQDQKSLTVAKVLWGKILHTLWSSC